MWCLIYRLSQSMSVEDWLTLKKLYGIGHGCAHPAPGTDYETLARYLTDHEALDIEVEVDNFLDMKDFFVKVIAWGSSLCVPPAATRAPSALCGTGAGHSAA
jgi:hypothetical protein